MRKSLHTRKGIRKYSICKMAVDYSVKTNSTYVLQPYLPDQTNIPYRLSTRPHNMTMINKTKFLNDTDFIIRMLYKYSY